MYKVKVDEKLLCFTGSVNGMEYVTDQIGRAHV